MQRSPGPTRSSAPRSRVPVRVFKLIYILLLLYGLFDLGTVLSSSTPVYIQAIPGEGNAIVGHVLYVGTLMGAGIFIFAVYLSFEAFENRRGPFNAISMPAAMLPRISELLLRFALVAMLTVKWWRPQTDSDATLFVAIIALALLIWTLLVKFQYSAKISIADILGNVVLALFAVILVWFVSDFFRSVHYGLAAVLIMALLALALLGFGAWLLKRIGREMADDFVDSVKRVFVK